MEFIRAEGETDEMYRKRFLERAETIKSQEELNTCNDGKRKTDVLIATIEKCEKLEEKLKIVKEALEFYSSEDNYSHYDSKNNIICNENCGDIAREALKKIKE